MYDSTPMRSVSDDKRHLGNYLKSIDSTERLDQRKMMKDLPHHEQTRINAEIAAIRKEYASPVLR